ncbi:MAG: OsmC family protein [Saprospiraceae bacterium]|nr:OsmC family protein [Saprospiraceae bacterium]
MITATIHNEKYQTLVTNGTHTIIADEPETNGGRHLGPSPGEILCAALASCSTITMRMYADRKGWPLYEARVEVDMAYVKEAGIVKTTFIKTIHLEGDLTEEQRLRLADIAARCPVHQALLGEITIESSMP